MKSIGPEISTIFHYFWKEHIVECCLLSWKHHFEHFEQFPNILGQVLGLVAAVVVVSLDQHLVRFGPAASIRPVHLFVLYPLLGIAVLAAIPNQDLFVLAVVFWMNAVVELAVTEAVGVNGRTDPMIGLRRTPLVRWRIIFEFLINLKEPSSFLLDEFSKATWKRYS